MVPLEYYLSVSAILLVSGVFGIFLNRNNVLIILMSLELILAAVNINFVAFNAMLSDVFLNGQIFSIFIITIAAAEVGIGLAIVLMLFRNRETANINEFDLMKW